MFLEMIGKKSGGSLEILNRNLKAQKPNSVFKQNNRTLDTNVTLSLRIKDCDSSPFKLKFKCTKCNVVYNVKNETLDVFPLTENRKAGKFLKRCWLRLLIPGL